MVQGARHQQTPAEKFKDASWQEIELTLDSVEIYDRTTKFNKVRCHTKITIYKSLIRPVVLYGHEAWILRADDQRALGVFERKMLRTIYGGVQMGDGT